jgi:glycine/D-amino acid oxidase-like deaminating enzyme
LLGDFSRLFPDTGIKPEFSWTGTFGSTRDGLPFIGEYKPRRHSYFSLGFGGNGITFSVIAAAILTDLIRGRKNKDAALFAFDRV